MTKWSGLTGFTGWYGRVGEAADIWLANGFSEWRDIRDYSDTINVEKSKLAVIAANAKGLKAIWGVSSWTPVVTANNWPNYREAILAAAQWAQDNGVYEFQLGNEMEGKVDGTTMTIPQFVANLKAVATEVKQIFTNGKVSYSATTGHLIDDWLPVGKGDIDILAFNVYRGGHGTYTDEWKSRITTIVNALGVDGTYITEFNLSSNNVNEYSTDEAVQAAALAEMINYIKASGIKRALFYTWHDNSDELLGVVKADGSYRELWQSLIH